MSAADRQRLVLRADPEGAEDLGGRARELEVLRVAHGRGIRVPKPMWLHGDGRGLVMSRVNGDAIPRRLLRDERYATARSRLLGQAAAAAASLHSIDPRQVGSLRLPMTAPATAAVEALEGELDRLGEPHPALELGLRWLRRNLPVPRPATVVHGDFRLGNLMVDANGLAAVLDWELCHAGEAVEDLGWLCIRSWRFGADEHPAAGVGTRDELLAAYFQAGGRRVSRDELRFWEVLGNVRWGVICVAQADTHLSGAHPSLERAAIGRRACEPEWDLLAMVGAPEASPAPGPPEADSAAEEEG